MSSTPTKTEKQVESDPFFYGYRYKTVRDTHGRLHTIQVPLTLEDVLHPQEEDVVMQRPTHERDCVYLRNVARVHLRDQPDAVVLHDCRVDWQVEGVKPHGPDIAVFRDVRREWDQNAGTFRCADTGARVVLVIEVTSPNTRSIDVDAKVTEYHQAGVPLYVIVDHLVKEDGLQVVILAYRHTPEGYVRLPATEEGRVWLEPLGMWIGSDAEGVALYDADGEKQPDPPELAEALRQADARNEELQKTTEEAIQARKDAEAKAATEEKARKDAEAKVATEEKARKDAEAREAGLKRELDLLRAQLSTKGEAP